LGYRVDTLDPATDMDLASYRRAYPERVGGYSLVFSTSVIEHVPDDAGFVADMAAMLVPGGYVVLTCDYRDDWTPDQRKPSSDVRIYNQADMDRLLAAMGGVELVDDPDWDEHKPDFTISEFGEEMLYGFATLAVRRSGEHAREMTPEHRTA
jgi:SAM-dependent methyltransferase